MGWYSKYLYLKKCQQIALDEWRAKTKPKKVPYDLKQKSSTEKGFSVCKTKRNDTLGKNIGKRG